MSGPGANGETVMPRLILGHTTESSIKIWVRASLRWPVAFIALFEDSGLVKLGSISIETQAAEFHTAVHEWTGLKANTDYRVKVYFGKTRKDRPEALIRDAYSEGRFTTFPASDQASDFTFILGSCNLHSLGIIERPDQAWSSISQIAKAAKARFMIHAGDQIYADIPFKPSSSLEHYRDKYLDAWDDCVPARKVLTELPHYMVMDDHEITNNFDNCRAELDRTLPLIALKVYWEFQHSHNPSAAANLHRYHYAFNFGDVQFFATDTRSKRDSSRGQMIDEVQMTALLAWMSKYKDHNKFVISSVPFVGEVLNPDRDKWCDPIYDAQRLKILNHVLDKDINHLTFLTGDMHTSYHATMEVTDTTKPYKAPRIIHELMSSPINQFTPSLPAKSHYATAASRQIEHINYSAQIHDKSYYGSHSNVMAISVSADKTIGYEIFRTTTNRIKPAIKGEF